jgi:hypothetical protein
LAAIAADGRRWRPKAEWPVRANNIWLLAQSSDVWDRDATKNYPPQSLLSQLYSPPNPSSVGGGYGWERPWLYTKGQPFVSHENAAYFTSSEGCNWFDPN